MESENSEPDKKGAVCESPKNSEKSKSENKEIEMSEERNKQLLRENWVAKAVRYRLSAQLQQFVNEMAESEDLFELAQCQFIPLQDCNT